jgi:hypothetical protein
MRRLRKMTSRATEEVAWAVWFVQRERDANSDRRCKICGRKMLASEDYGGDCVFCMAAFGDDVAIAHVEQLVEAWKAETIRGPSG